MKLSSQLGYILGRRGKIEGLLLLCCMALGALFEAVGVGLVVPFIAVLSEPQLLLNSPLTQPMLSVLNIREPQQLLPALGLALVGALLAKSAYLVLLYRWLFRYVFETQVKLSRRLFTAYLSAPYTFHLERNSAELLKGMTETVQRFSTGFMIILLVVLGECLVVMALVTLLLFIDPVATFGALLVVGIPTALIYRSMHRQLAGAGQTAEQSMASMIQWIEQAVGGIKETLIMNRASFFVDRHAEYARRFANSWRSFTLLSHIPRLVIDTLAAVAIVFIALVIMARGQDMQSILPILGLFVVGAIRLVPSVTRIVNGLAQLRFHYAATEVLFNELQKTQGSEIAPRPTSNGDRMPCRSLEESLVLDHLSYWYPSGTKPAIDDVSLEIVKGHWVALVGPTGAGKTTLVDLMLGLLTPSAGMILVDGRDLYSDRSAWQRNVGYVPQHVYLLDDTIRRNVAFGLPDHEIDDELVWQALHAAQVDNVVRALPDGLSAMIGERGDRLSGGERQRLGIARALYRDPQILVVDEGTAHLDNETELAVTRVLAKLRGEKTVIVIAHRLHLLKECDRIYVIKEGRLTNSGLYSDLFTEHQSV